MMQTSPSSDLAAAAAGPSNMPDTRSGLTRQGSVARTNAIAMLKRAASQREMKAKADPPALPGAFPSESPVPFAASNSAATASDPDQSSLPLTTMDSAFDPKAARDATSFANQTFTHTNRSSDPLTLHPSHNQHLGQYSADNALASTSYAPTPSAMLAPPSSNDSSDRSRSPMFQDRSNQRPFNRSPLPSLEQLRARILLERESAAPQPSASTSAASQAARAYALEKLLGNSGTDVFYDHTPDGTPIGRGAATPSPTPMSGRDNDLADMASDDESAHETRLKRQSIKNRPSLRRSRTINGLTAMAEAQNKAEFVQGVFLAVPGPASNRISRIHQRRVERQSMLNVAKTAPSQASVPQETIQDPVSPLASLPESAPTLSRQQSQRQIARTEMMRKLSTRGRENAAAAPQPASDHVQNAHPSVNASAIAQPPRLPRVITNSPAVDETISPVGVVIRPPSSPVPPHIPHLNTSASSSPAPASRQALSPSDAHAHAAAPSQEDQLAVSSPRLKASSSAASLSSHYAPSNATAHHLYERNRESAMALLNNEDSFGYEASPSMPSTSMDVGTLRTRIIAHPTQNDDQDDDATLQAAISQNGHASDNEGLNLDLGTARKKRRAGLVGLGLDSVPPQAAAEVEADRQEPRAQQLQTKDPAGLSPGKSDVGSSKRVSQTRQSLTRLRVQPTTQDLLSSPGSYTDEEALEDDAFYQLYSPATGGLDDDDETDEDENDEEAHVRSKQFTSVPEQTHQTTSQRGSESQPATAVVQGLGLIQSGGTPNHSQQTQGAEPPTTPPQRLFYRGIASVPCDPSPSTETEFGEARRTPWLGSSPGGFNLPLRLDNSLMSTAHAIISDSPATDPSPVMRGPGPSRKARGDWPMSVASSGTLHQSRESLESRSEAEARIRSSEEGGVYSGAPAIGSPLIELPEDEVMKEVEHDSRQPTATPANVSSSDSDFELLSVPSARTKPSERVQAMLGSSFVAEYGVDLEADSRSRSSIGGDDEHNLKVPTTGAHGSSSLSNNTSNVSINDLSDVDGEVDDAYLRKVDRMADKLGKIARSNKVNLANSGSTSANGVTPAVRPKLQRSNTSTGSRFTEHVTGPPPLSHSQRPSADLSALVGNEKLHPFPGLSQASPVQSQEGFSHMAVSAAPPSSLPAPVQSRSAQPSITDSPPAAAGEQDSNGKQIGLFSSLRRKASSLRRAPSAAKEGGSFWARRGKKDESPKLPTEATFISAPILTTATPGSTPTPTQPTVTIEKPHGEDGNGNGSGARERDNDATFEHRLFDGQLADKRTADLKRNASISSVVSARIRTDLQDGTADADGSSSSDHHGAAASSLAPNTAAMIHRYSRMLSTAGPTQAVPGASLEDMQDPPRKVLATDPVFQVISATTIKDRYLFLFSDILVIAKPVAAPGAEAGQTLGKMKQSAILPSLSWKFAVKNILELHRLKVSVTTNTRTASAKTRAQNPVLWGFVSHFSKDPDAAVRALVAKTGLEPTPASIAQLLYQTPELDRDDLTQYLGHASRRELLKAYVSQHRHVGVSIESALRSLLLDLRFPTDLDAFEALLVHFAQSWTQHNASMIKPTFTAQIASDLVFAIMALNDALHTGSQAVPSSATSPNFPRPVTVVTPALFSAPCRELSKTDFVSVFRQHDPEEVLSDRTLGRIYLSIRSEPLVQALDRFEPRFTIRVKGGKLPTRLTYAQPAEPVTLVIPAPDPDLAIRLYAQDTTFEPPVLTFSTSNEASFTMWTKSLGPKQVVFVRAGRNARFYGGTEVDVTPSTNATNPSEGVEDSPLPRSFNVTVERAFMKHSFTLTSIAPGGANAKRFMFSFEDAEKVERWTKKIREQAEASIKAKAVRTAIGASGDPTTLRATETAALQVLRETLIAPDDEVGDKVVAQGGLNRAATVSGPTSTTSARAKVGMDGELGSHPRPAPSTGLGVAGLRAPVLDRTTSTSRHYYAASGVGRHERELLIPPSSSTCSSLASTREEGRMPHQAHTKGSASLSLYPPSTSVARLGAISPATSVARSNSARSASSPLSGHMGLPTVADRADAASGHVVAGTMAGTTTTAEAAANGLGVGQTQTQTQAQNKVMLGTQIVNVARLNSLLVSVVGFHQAQAQAQVHQQRHQQ
ncbi:uncharacterized protein UTRI_06179_B [Ustilago trichophora]|uniref:SEC7 domain-containing protein n=1 Tax=Ustilago trichophora TaxID=86804 RepID=A0A5C3EHM3_9BASI|nr:uncharacterized protein UTRI_06179_B [Ustilago trichophora]